MYIKNLRNLEFKKILDYLSFREKIVALFFKKYTYKIYRIGVKKGYEWNN